MQVVYKFPTRLELSCWLLPTQPVWAHSRRKSQGSGLTHSHGLWETRGWWYTGDRSGLCQWTGVHTETQKNNYPPVELAVQCILKPDSNSSSCTDGLLECQWYATLTVCSGLRRVTLCRKCSRVFHRAHWGKMQVKVKMQSNRESTKPSKEREPIAVNKPKATPSALKTLMWTYKWRTKLKFCVTDKFILRDYS